MSDEIILTEEQKRKVLEVWNENVSSPPSLKKLTQIIFNISEIDGRSEEARALKKYLSSLNLRAKATSDYESKINKIILSEEQKTTIINHASTMNASELSKLIFNNNSLTNLSAETRVVYQFIKTLDTRVIYNQNQNEDIPEDTSYEPPNTLDKALRRANKYVNGVLDKDKLRISEKKGLEALINYLHTYKFILQMNSYDSKQDRDLCEDAFIRSTYDKPDLQQEEIDQYIEYANQVVRGFAIRRRSEQMQRLQEEAVSGNRNNNNEEKDTEKTKLYMSLVEAIGKAGTEYDQCLKRQNELLDNLKEKRSSRISKQVKDNASVNNLVQAWRDEEYRIKMIKLGELEQLKIKDEIEKLTNMEEIRARIFGINKESILLG